MRQLANGDVVFTKGRPPGSLPGYTVDKRDPMLFHKDIPACVQRSVIKVTLPCGKIQTAVRCNKLSITGVTADYCCSCTVVESPSTDDAELLKAMENL